MGIFNVLSEIGKNNKNFKEWEKQEKDKFAQRKVLHEKNPATEEELKKAAELGETVINVIDVMDNHSESVAENVETATQPIVGIAPMLGAAGTGYLSYKGILKNSYKKLEEIATEFNKSAEAQDFYRNLREYNEAQWKKNKSGCYYRVNSWFDNQFHKSRRIKDPALKAQAEKLSKEYLKKTSFVRGEVS